MFELFVFACMTQEIKCFMIIDEYAPYKTKQEFLDAYNDPDRQFKQILYKGNNTNVFTHRNNIWKYRDVVMGTQIEEAIAWLKENDDLTPSIRKEINSFKV